VVRQEYIEDSYSFHMLRQEYIHLSYSIPVVRQEYIQPSYSFPEWEKEAELIIELCTLADIITRIKLEWKRNKTKSFDKK